MMDLSDIRNLRPRPANNADMPQLQALIKMSMHVLAGRDYSQEQIESALLYLMGVDPHLIEDGTYTVAELDGEIVAAGGWSRRQALYGRGDAVIPTEPALLRPGFESARLRALFVHPRWARRGLGRLLVKLAEYAAREQGFRNMELVATLTAVPLYQACGYRQVKAVDITLPDGILFPGVLMRKSLTHGLGIRPLGQHRKTATGGYYQVR